MKNKEGILKKSKDCLDESLMECGKIVVCAYFFNISKDHVLNNFIFGKFN